VGSTDLAAALVTGKIWFRVPSTIKFVYDGTLPEGTYSKDVILHMCKTLTSRGATYKALEIYGTVIDAMSVDARMTISNMVVEVGAKVGLMPCDGRVREYVRQRTNAPFKGVEASGSAIYERVIREDLSDLPPQVAKPHEVDNVVDVSQVAGTELDQVYIGTCTNGRLEDLAAAASLFRRAGGGVRKVAHGVRLIIIPASSQVLQAALTAGYVETFIAAGAMLGVPGCGPCMGNHLGVPDVGETVISTANRNFMGRMGNRHANIYLASPQVVAASAILGRIAGPEEIVDEGRRKKAEGRSEDEALL